MRRSVRRVLGSPRLGTGTYNRLSRIIGCFHFKHESLRERICRAKPWYENKGIIVPVAVSSSRIHGAKVAPVQFE